MVATQGLASSPGIVPLTFSRDRGGPMCRIVEDTAAMPARRGLDAGLSLPVSWTCRLFRYGLTHHWQHLHREQLNRCSHFRVWQAADVDLGEKPIVSE
jgi:hypothetical protein